MCLHFYNGITGLKLCMKKIKQPNKLKTRRLIYNAISIYVADFKLSTPQKDTLSTEKHSIHNVSSRLDFEFISQILT